MKKVIQHLEALRSSLYSMDCTFWACKNTPENNRIESMVTCSRCQSIIVVNRHIKKLQKLN